MIEYERLTLRETQEVFDCCLVRDCERCPLYVFPGEMHVVSRMHCQNTLKANIRYWLGQAKDGEQE